MQTTPEQLHLHLPGERRRAVALASLVSLAVYLLWEGLAAIPNSSFGHQFAHLLGQPVWLQAALVAPIWLGTFVVALAQRQLIAHREGAYAALQAITHVRGMRGPGLTLGLVMLALLIAGAVFNVLMPHLLIVGALASTFLIALGLPHAPAARYEFRPDESTIMQYNDPRVSVLPAPPHQYQIDQPRSSVDSRR